MRITFHVFKKHTIYYQWPTISKVASSRRLIWVCVDSEEKPVEVPWQHWKLAWTNKNTMSMTFRGAPTWSPLSHHETWPVLMGSLVGCKAQAPLLLFSSVLHGCVLRFFCMPSISHYVHVYFLRVSLYSYLVGFEDRPTQQEFTKWRYTQYSSK